MYFFRQALLILIVAQCAAPAANQGHASGSRSRLGSPKPPNVILITLDTTRADRMGFLGSTRGLTPNLDALARGSAVFTHAYSQVPLTTPSHATILTGTYPQFHGLVDFPMALPNDVPSGPEVLQGQGYRTAAFVGSVVLDPKGFAPGLDRGFDTYAADFHAEDHKKHFHKKDRYQTIERRGDEVISLALAWLNQHQKASFFLWIHLYDAHAPYEPPEPYNIRYASEPYDGGIAYEDAVVGKFIRQLKARGLYDGAVIAVTADHGESLGAHGEDTHGVFLYDETIHVPLVIKLPHMAVTGKRIENRVELVDVMPTLLQAVDVPVPGEMQGDSMLSLIKAKDAETIDTTWRDRPAYAQADYPRLSFGWSALQTWRTGKYLYVQAPRPELYNQTTDPKAEHNLASTSTTVADTLAAKMNAFRIKTSSQRERPKATVDPDAEQKLAALGYAASSSSNSKSTEQGPDPKDRTVALHLIENLPSVLEDGRFAEAIPMLLDLIAKEPNISQLHLKLANCYMGLRQYEKAIPALRKALEVYPGNDEVEMNLGKALLETKDYTSAETTLKNVIAKKPKLLAAHILLEATYLRSNRYLEAIKECKDVLADLPDDYDSNLILGLSLAELGKREEAVPKLQKAASVRPEAPEPHMVLAVVYTKLGRTADADLERAEAIRLGAKPPASHPTPLR